MTTTATHFGLPTAPQGAVLYGNVAPRTWESDNGNANGMHMRLAGRTFQTKFANSVKINGMNGASSDGEDVVAFKAGARVYTSVSNYTDSGFTYLKAAAGQFDATLIDPWCQRIAALPYSSPVSGFDTYGGYTQPYIWVIQQHEVNQNAKIGAYASKNDRATTGAEYLNFCRHVQDRLNYFGCRNRVQFVICSNSGIPLSTMDPFMAPGIFDEYGYDLYCNFDPSTWNYQGHTDSFATLVQPGLAWARKWGITKMSMPEWGLADSGNYAEMRQWYIDAVNYMTSVPDIDFTTMLHWSQPNKPSQDINYSPAQDTGTSTGHPGKHDGVVAAWALIGSNAVIGGAPPSGNLDTPTALVAKSSADGTSIELDFAAVPSVTLTDQLDFYKQGPGDQWPVKDNATPIAAAGLTSYVFAKNITPDTAYLCTLVGSNSGTKQRTGYATPFASVTTNKPGPTNSAPTIVNPRADLDPYDDFTVILSASATDADGDTVTFKWDVKNMSTGLFLPTFMGSSVSYTYPSADEWDALLTVTDSKGAVTTSHVTFVTGEADAYTQGIMHLRMLQTGENIQDAGVIDRETKPEIENYVTTAYLSKSGSNAAMQLAASSCDPRNATSTYTPSPKDLIFSLMKMEDIGAGGVVAMTNRSGVGTGLVVGIWDQFGTPIVNYPLDHFVTQADGAVREPFPYPAIGTGTPGVGGMTPSDLVIVGVWHPASGSYSTQPIYRVTGSDPIEALINCQVLGGVNIPRFGVLQGVDDPTVALDFSKYNGSINGQIFLGLQTQHPWSQENSPDAPTNVSVSRSTLWSALSRVTVTRATTWNVAVPTDLLFNNMESPASGTTLTNTSGGNGDGSTPWPLIELASGGTLQTDSTRSHSGTQSLKVASGSTSGIVAARMKDAGLFTTGTKDIYWRLYVYLTALPTTGIRLVQFLTDLNAIFGGQITIPTNGKLNQLDRSSSVSMGQQAAAIPTGQWVRLEGYMHADISAGYSTLRRYDSPESLTVSEETASAHTFATAQGSSDNIEGCRIGLAAATANNGPFWVDDVAWSAQGWIGPKP